MFWNGISGLHTIKSKNTSWSSFTSPVLTATLSALSVKGIWAPEWLHMPLGTHLLLWGLQLVCHLFVESPSKVRLVGGAHRCEGRVEIERNGQWGTVCDDGWDWNDLVVVCRELNCGAAKRTQSGASYMPPAPEDQKVLIQDVNCSGTEDLLSQCKQNEDVYNCPHSEDAGARCVSKYGRLKDHLPVV